MQHEVIPVNRKALKINIGQSVMISDVQEGDKRWEKYVPMVVANVIKEKELFGYSK